MKRHYFYSKKGYPCVRVTFEIGDVIENCGIVIERTSNSIKVKNIDGSLEDFTIKTNSYFGDIKAFNKSKVMVSVLEIKEFVNCETKMDRIVREAKQAVEEIEDIEEKFNIIWEIGQKYNLSYEERSILEYSV